MTTTADTITVLHVDDDPDFADLASTFLEREDDRIQVRTATSAADGLDLLEDHEVDCLVSDYDMPGTNGIEFLETVREEHPELPFILYTGKGSEEVASDAISAGVTDYLQKQPGTDHYKLLVNRIANAVEQVRAERSLDRTRRYFQRLVEEATDTILVVDSNATISFATPSAEAILGRSPDDLVGSNGLEPIHPADRDDVAGAFNALVEHPGESRTVEFRYERPDGSWIWLEARGRNLLDDSLIDGIVVYARDTTERRERENDLQQERDRFRAVFQKSFDAMVITDEDGKYIDVNRSATELFGVPKAELLGKSIEEFAADDFDFESAWQRFHESETERGTFPLRRADGTERTVEYAATMHITPGQHLSVLRDVTERESRERELERQNERLEEFANIVSHDLRNPLSVAEGNLELVREECESEHLSALSGALDRMNTLIEDLLTLASEGEDVTDPEPVDVRSLVDGCWANVETADATLVTDIDRTVQADESRLKQLFENLFRNAVEHGSTSSQSGTGDAVEHGSTGSPPAADDAVEHGPTSSQSGTDNAVEHGGADVTVTVGALASGFYVEDDGTGIPPDERDDVFAAGYSTAAEGTGFGLRIVEQVATAHGWDVRVTSGSDGGARFEITGVTFSGR